MTTILYYVAYGSLYLVSLLPFWLLYRVSDLLYLIIRLSGYRRKIVYQNLTNAFPEKKPAEINALANAYFRYMCDLALETIKILTFSEAQAQKRCVFHCPPWFKEMQEKKQSVVLLMGHFGNWEWAAPTFTLNTKFQLLSIYRRLANKTFDRVLAKIRTRFGTQITPDDLTLRTMVSLRKELSATAFVADQSPIPQTAYWSTFLHQDTGFFYGPEKLSKKFNYPVVYIGNRRKKRGYYEIFPELICEHPQQTHDGEILEIFIKKLETDIRNIPETWLWSHRRWKRKRPPGK